MSGQVVVYVRVSTKEQVEEGNSLAVQERICREYATRNGYEVSRVFIEEGESAKTANRTQIKKLMAYCAEHHKDLIALVIYRIDRLSRDTVDYANLKMFFNKIGMRVLSTSENLEDSPVGRFVETTLASVSQLDNEIRAERSKGGMIEAVREGRWQWRAPRGYVNSKVDGFKNITPSSDTKLVGWMRRSWELVDNGCSKQHARRLLQQEGLNIAKTQFDKMFAHKIYKGVIEAFGLSIHSPSIIPLIEPELFDRVYGRLYGGVPKQRTYNKLNPEFPLRGTILCLNGHSMTGSTSRGNGGRYSKYHCLKCKGKGTTHDATAVHDTFKQLIGNLEYQMELKDALVAAIEMNWNDRASENRKVVVSIDKRLEQLGAKSDMIVDKNLSGVYSDSRTKQLLDKNEVEVTSCKLERQAFAAKDEDVAEIVQFGFSVLERIGTIWGGIEDIEVRHRFQKWLFPSGVVYDGKKFGTARLPLCLSIKRDQAIAESLLVPQEGIEPPTLSLGRRRSIH